MPVRLWGNESPCVLLEMQIGTALKENCKFKIKVQNVQKKTPQNKTNKQKTTK